MTARLAGVDLGGTSIRVALARSEGGHGDLVHRDTPAHEGPAAVFDAIADAVAEACGDGSCDGLAIGIPGPLDPRTGVVITTPHLRGFDGVNARAELSRRVHCEVAVHNDAKLAGYAEWTVGAGRGTHSFVYATVSTGIGGAVIVQGELLNGEGGTAGEIGHMPAWFGDGASCDSGHPGCLEALASGTSIARRAREAVQAGEPSSLSGCDLVHLSAREVEAAAEAGDALAARVYREGALAMGYALGGLINLLSPQVIAVGGGLINAGRLLFDPLDQGVRAYAFPHALKHCRVVPAALGTDAGLVGAVAWAVRSFGATAT